MNLRQQYITHTAGLRKVYLELTEALAHQSLYEANELAPSSTEMAQVSILTFLHPQNGKDQGGFYEHQSTVSSIYGYLRPRMRLCLLGSRLINNGGGNYQLGR